MVVMDSSERISNIFFIFSCCLFFFSSPSFGLDDPYKILGIERSANLYEIKAAYHRKALETHPDKVQNVDPEVAAETFSKVTNAYEILSDPATRREFEQDWKKECDCLRPEKNADVIKEQSIVTTISTLQQLRELVLDKNQRLKKNLYMALVCQENVETIIDDTLLFPHPFTSSTENDIHMETMIQPVKVRFDEKSEICRFFNITNDEYRKDSFHVIFGHKGENLTNYELYSSSIPSRMLLNAWVISKQIINVTVSNHHHTSVDLYEKFRYRSNHLATISPGECTSVTQRLGHVIFATDSRLNKYPGAEKPRFSAMKTPTTIGVWSVSGDPILIEAKFCYDLSSSCDELVLLHMPTTCEVHPEYMHGICAKSCKFCVEKPSTWFYLQHAPLVAIPIPLREGLKVLRSFLSDFQHVWKMRKNGAFSFYFLGCICGIVLPLGFLKFTGKRVTWLLCFAFIVSGAGWILFRKQNIFSALFISLRKEKNIHAWLLDMEHIFVYRRNVAAFFVANGFAGTFVTMALFYLVKRKS